MSAEKTVEQRFMNDVRDHVITVLRDDGVDRHLRFKRPNRGAYWFDLLTWPGALCIDGDCGTYVFRRLEDMFEFFRTDREHKKGDGLAINPRYWGEKLQAVARHGGYEEFSEARFRANVKDYFDSWCKSNDPDEERKTALRLEITDSVLACSDEGEDAAFSAVRDFESDDGTFGFVDFYDYRFTDYTSSFLWCCYAIAWGVRLYDAQGAQPGCEPR